MSRLHWIVFVLFIFALNQSFVHPSKTDKLPSPSASVDRYGDPLPKYALERLGTIRFRHSAGIKSLQFSSDGKVLATIGHDESVCVWGFPTGKLLWRFSDANLDYHKVAFSPNGKKLLLACSQMKQFNGCHLRLVDLEAKKTVELPAVHGQVVQGLYFSADEQTFYSVSQDCICFWNTETTQPISQRLRNWPTGAMAIAPKRNLLAFASNRKEDPLVRIQNVVSGNNTKNIRGIEKESCNAESGEVSRSIVKPQQPIIAMAFSNDGKHLATGSPHAPIRIWDPANGKVLQTLAATKGAVVLCFSPDGKYVASANMDGFVQVWSVKSGECIRKLSGYSGWPNALQFSPDNKTIALAGDSSRTVHVWNVSTGKNLAQESGHIGTIRALAFSEDRQSLLSVSSLFGEKTAVYLWRPEKDHTRPRMTLTKRIKQDWWLRDVAITPNASELYFPDERLPAIHRLDATSGKVKLGIQKQAAAFDDTKPGSVILSVTLDPQNNVLATGSSDGTICLSHRHSGKTIRLWKTENAGITSLEISIDGKYLVSANEQRRVCLWDASTGKKIREFGNRTDMIEQVCISPDNKFVVALSQWHKGRTYWWDCKNGNELHRLAEFDDKLHCMAFSPNGKMLAVAGDKGFIHLFEVHTGKQRCCFKGHSGSISALAFSADGLQLASGGADTTILIWDVTADGLSKAPCQEDLEQLYDQLGSDDARRAYDAMWRLVSAAEHSHDFLKTKLRPQPTANANEMNQIIEDLDHDSYAKRTSSMQKLMLLGKVAQGPLREACKRPSSAEAQRRIQSILKKLEYSELSHQSVLDERVRETLQWIAVTNNSASLQTKLSAHP